MRFFDALAISLLWIAGLTAGGVFEPWAWAVVGVGFVFGVWAAGDDG